MMKIIFILCVTLLAACSKQAEQNKPAEQGVAESAAEKSDAKRESHIEINWFDGTVEQAFAEAKKQNKPLFLYWGAVWCPPCNELKATVFKRREFIEQTRMFVPVYLDGDKPGAQKQGETFKVQGYPTLIVFDANGSEVTRIPGGLNLERYADVLELVLTEIKPVKELVKQIMSEDSSEPSDTASSILSDNDFRLLAYYSWTQDNQQVLADDSAVETLKRVYERCPESLKVEKSRLFFAYLNSAIKTFKDSQKNIVSQEFIESNLPILRKILQDTDTVLANVTAIRYEDGDTIRYLTEENAALRGELIAQWRGALQIIARASNLSSTERLGSLYGQVSLDKLTHGKEITPDLKQNIKSSISQARRNIENKYEHSAIVNMSRNILVHAGMEAYAEEIIAEEVRNAASPYYFMLELADFAQKEGRKEEALSWFAQAYEESAKGATRFQWGVYYLGGMIEIVPEQEDKITQLALELIDILATSENGFYNRNTQRLKDMEAKLLKWNEGEQHNEAISDIRSALRKACDGSQKLYADGEHLENRAQGKVATIQCEEYLL